MNPTTPLALDPIWIPGQIDDIQTEGALCGVNYNMIHDNEGGLLITLLAYQNMQEGDWIDVFWGDDESPVSNGRVEPEQVGQNFSLYVTADKVPEGIHALHAEITRAGGGNGGVSPPLSVLVRTLIPGGIDPEPDVPNHQDLLPPQPELPPGGIIDDDAAKAGIKVTIPGYLNMRLYDVVTLSWGGVQVRQEVTQADVDANQLVILVGEEVIRSAGDSDQLVLTYRIRDEVHNLSDGWSMRTYVIVEIGQGLFDAPIISNPDPDAEPVELIDLDKLGDDDLQVTVMVLAGAGLQRNDELTLTWIGITSQDETLPIELGPERITQVPGFVNFLVPNAEVRDLGQGRGVASYTATRAGVELGGSKRAFAEFIGSEARLPKPTVEDAVGDTLDPTLAQTMVIVPGAALEANDVVYLTWLGTRANGTPLHRTFQRGVSSGGAGQPMYFPIDGADIAPLDGGRVEVFYRLYKDSSGSELDSEREVLRVGEASAELPAPTTRPAAVDEMLDPEDITLQLQLVVPPWPGMQDGQTVHILWRASSGPDHVDYMQISAPMEGHEVLFPMERDKVEEYLDEQVELSYWVETPGEAARHSDTARFRVGAPEEPVVLPLPYIIEADGGVIDPDKVPNGATLFIDASARFKDNDQVRVHVIGSAEGGSTVIDGTVRPGEGDKAFTLTLPYSVIDANEGSTFDLKYEVTRAAGGPVEISDTVTYAVEREEKVLPLPEILQAEGFVLDPDDVLNGATVRIDASARFKDGDRVLIKVIGSVQGGSRDIVHMVPPGQGGEEVRATVPWQVIDANAGRTFDLRYEITRAAGGPVEMSKTVTYMVVSDVADGPLLVMGARFNASLFMPTGNAQVLSALHRTTLVPVTAEWRYEDESRWTKATSWLDTKSSLKLYVRSGSETWEIRKANIFGNGAIPDSENGHAAFVALRDEVIVGNDVKVDMVAWGNRAFGGELDDRLSALDNVADVSMNSYACAARLRDGSLVCWGFQDNGGGPETIEGDFVEVRGTNAAFVGRKSNGDLHAWGKDNVVMIPGSVSRHKDYVELCCTTEAGAARRKNGQVVAWGREGFGGKMHPGQELFDDVFTLAANLAAFAALRVAGTSRKVITWGHAQWGGTLPTAIANRTDVKRIAASTVNSFCIMLETGGVMAWPNGSHGGEVPGRIADLKNIVDVTSTSYAYCARLSNGQVVAWGHPDYGGTLTHDVEVRSNIVQVAGNYRAFAAVCSDGRVVAWGDQLAGGNIAPVANQLFNVLAIYGNTHGFAALTSDGRVVTWGIGPGGGNSDHVQSELRGKVTHSRRLSASEAESISAATHRYGEQP